MPLYPPMVTPSARVLPLAPFLLRFIRNPLRALPQAVYEQGLVSYGNSRPLVWVTDPGLIEIVLLKEAASFPKTRLDRRVLSPIVGQGLLTAEGDHWRWQRKLASPLFRQAEILKYVPAIVAATNEQIARWRKVTGTIDPDIPEDMTELTFAVIARTVLAGINEKDAASVKAAGRAYLDKITWEIAATLLSLPDWVWHPGKSRMRRASRDVRAAVQNLLDQRRATSTEGDDLVARMLTAANPDTGAAMTDAQIVDNLATFLLAGHETTAKALAWTLYLLARAPEWQERCRREVLEVSNGGPIEAQHLGALATLTRVLKEAMRLYPPVPVMTRVATADMTLGETRLSNPTLVVIPIYAVHRHTKLWPDPNLFDPDRFLPEREAQYPRTQYMPFGFGPRVCIGSAFAMTEAVAVLATLLQKVSFSWDGRSNPEPVSRVTLRPKGKLGVKIAFLQ